MALLTVAVSEREARRIRKKTGVSSQRIRRVEKGIGNAREAGKERTAGQILGSGVFDTQADGVAVVGHHRPAGRRRRGPGVRSRSVLDDLLDRDRATEPR
ncbi:MAG: hypothetical protein OXU75_04955 [Deltaproteobacteria bacterium]|nr:hypothetical protein [Deltaproteobacteria bacterium]